MKIKYWLVGILLLFGITLSNCYKLDIIASAEGTLDGIILNFKYISKDVNYLEIWYMNRTENEDYPINYIETYAIIDGNRLIDLRNTGNLLLPFVKSGNKYQIAYNYRDNIDNIINPHRYIGKDRKLYIDKDPNTLIVPNGGIYMINKPYIINNKENYEVKVSFLPTFSSDVIYFNDAIFSFNVNVIIKTQYENITNYYDYLTTNEWIYDFSEIINENIVKYDNIAEMYLVVFAFCNIIYEETLWSIGFDIFFIDVI